jgi:hypothetical protein
MCVQYSKRGTTAACGAGNKWEQEHRWPFPKPQVDLFKWSGSHHVRLHLAILTTIYLLSQASAMIFDQEDSKGVRKEKTGLDELVGHDPQT